MRLPVVVMSQDGEFRRRLQIGVLEAAGLPVQTIGTADDLRRAVALAPQSMFFLDVRSVAWTPETSRVLEWLESGDLQLPYLVTVNDGWLPFRWVETITAHEWAAIDAPCSRETLERLVSSTPESGRMPTGRTIPLQKSIATDQVRFATRTATLFPVIDQLRRIATHDVTLLLVGETGTGKTTLAQLIHGLSSRRTQPFQTVACGAMPGDLIESELFGHVRGAFTSADRCRMGRFEAAGQGTLLLDEIDTLSLKDQAKLLRVLETGEYEPVGSTETRTCQARLVVASNLDLEALAAENRFRTDLYYRLNVLQFVLPPLRERPLDIIPMACQFIAEGAQRHGIPVDRIQRDVLRALQRYTWPGNIREMKNQMQRAVLFSEAGALALDHLSANFRETPRPTEVEITAPSLPAWSLAEQVAKSERQILEDALRANDFIRTATARSLGITRVGLYKKMRRYGLLDARS